MAKKVEKPYYQEFKNILGKKLDAVSKQIEPESSGALFENLTPVINDANTTPSSKPPLTTSADGVKSKSKRTLAPIFPKYKGALALKAWL